MNRKENKVTKRRKEYFPWIFYKFERSGLCCKDWLMELMIFGAREMFEIKKSQGFSNQTEALPCCYLCGREFYCLQKCCPFCHTRTAKLFSQLC